MIYRDIPKGARKLADKKSTAVVYLEDRNGWFLVKGFQGKRSKSDFYYRFKKAEQRERYVRDYFSQVQATEKMRTDRAAKRKAFKNPYKVGDVFKSSWGYDQTNVDYYQVQEVRSCMLIVCEIASVSETDEKLGDRGRCSPSVGAFTGKPFRVKAQEGGFKVDGYRYASFLEPKIIAGVAVYPSSYWSAYA